MRDSLIFYRSFYDAIRELPEKMKPKVYEAIFEYSLNFNEIILDGLPKTIFILIKPQLDANNQRFINGKKGGKPKPNANQNVTKTEPNANQNVTKTKPNNNVNNNVNENVNENVNKNVNEEVTTATIFEAQKRNKITELFKRVTQLDELTIAHEVAKFMNKYPNIEPNKAGGLINTWASNIQQFSIIAPVKKMVI